MPGTTRAQYGADVLPIRCLAAAAQRIDPGVSAVCNTALLSNTAHQHHGHSQSSGHDAGVDGVVGLFVLHASLDS